ncbi:hypothetical protein D3C80_1843810 [compost metagenome]
MAGAKENAWLRGEADLAVEQSAVRHVGVVAGILEGPGFGAFGREPAKLQAHLHLLAFGQDDFYRIAAHAAEQQARRREAGGRGAAAGGQAAAKGGGLFGGFVTHRRA